MKQNFNRDLLFLVKNNLISKQAIEKEVNCLHNLLVRVESFAEFCKVYELVDRNRITQNPIKLLNNYQQLELKSFRFLICKN
jgi:hypothetical protein